MTTREEALEVGPRTKMHIGIDKGNGRDFTAVSLRVNEDVFVIPDPFARHLIPYLERKIALSPPDDEWQPIETAPRDGTHILLYRPIDDHRQRRAVQEGKFHRYGMVNTWRVMSGGVWDIDAPTHWMPLPKPPRNHVQGEG